MEYCNLGLEVDRVSTFAPHFSRAKTIYICTVKELLIEMDAYKKYFIQVIKKEYPNYSDKIIAGIENNFDTISVDTHSSK